MRRLAQALQCHDRSLMDANLSNGLVADSTRAVLADSKSSKQAQGRSNVPLETTGQQSASPAVEGEESTPTFQQALDKTLTAADTQPQATPLEDNWASTQAEEPRDGTASILGSGIVRSRKAALSTRSADLSTTAQTPGARQGRRPVTSQASPSGPQTQTQTQDGPADTDNKDPVPHRQDVAESDGTEPGVQIGQPAAWPEASVAASVSEVEVQDSPTPTAAEPVSGQGSKASRVGRTRVAGDSSVPVGKPLQQSPQGETATKTQEAPNTVATATDRPIADLSPAPGRPEGQDDTKSETSELDLQASSGLTSTTSVESELTVQSLGKVASQVHPDGQGLSMTIELRGSQGPSLDAARDTTDAGRTTSAAGAAKVAGGTDGQRSTETTQEIRLSGQTTDAGSASPDGPSHASSVYLSGQGLTLKDHLAATGHDGPSATQTQIWPNAGLSVEPLTDLNNATGGRIDGSTGVNSTGSDGPSVQEQVVSSIRGAVGTQTHQLSVELNPPELGKVLIHFEQQDHSVSGTLQVDNRATRAEIEQALPQIIQNLQDSGIQVKRLDVTLSDQYQQTFRDGSLADMYQGHSGQQDQGRAWPYTEQVSYLSDDPATSGVSTEPAGPQVAMGTNGSINLLM